MKMELLLFVIITTITLSFSMFKPCTSLQIQFQNTFPQDAAAASDHQLPRKLRFMEQMTTKIKPSNIEDDQQKQSSYHEGRKQLIKGKFVDHMKIGKTRVKVETWKDWVERKKDTTSTMSSDEIFTMDYSRVTRRRPIHNKGLPVSP